MPDPSQARLEKRGDRINKYGIRHLLVSRVDAIGDVILTLPLLGLLKKMHPNLQISFLGRTYTQSILAACAHVDTFVNWDEISEKAPDAQAQALAQLSCDAVLHVFPQRQVVKAARRARIALRLGTANRAYHWGGCNRLTFMGRAKSPWHEAQLNVLLAQRLGLLPGLEVMPSLSDLAQYYGLNVTEMSQDKICEVLSEKLSDQIDSAEVSGRVILHPGSRGSARDWPLAHFRALAEALLASGIRVYVTGTEKEGESFREPLEPVFAQGAVDMTGKLSLTELLSFIAGCDALVAASTGPLHMGAALGKRAVGIYPPIRPMHSGRWGPVGTQAEALSAGWPDCTGCQGGQTCACVQDVRPEQVFKAVTQFLQ